MVDADEYRFNVPVGMRMASSSDSEDDSDSDQGNPSSGANGVHFIA